MYVGTYQGNELTRNSSGNIRSQSSQLAEQLWTDPGLKSGMTVRTNLNFNKEKEKKKSAGGEWIVEHSPQILAREEKSQHHAIKARHELSGDPSKVWKVASTGDRVASFHIHRIHS